MELIYSMRRKPLKCEPPHFDNPLDTEVIRPIVTISVCNVIAFSSPTELTDGDGDTWGGHVYVCDLDTPWDSHKVTSTVHPVSALEWDNEGKTLLVATTAGDVSVYGQKEYLLNDWTCLYSASFPGEHIISAILFHNGRRVVPADKKPDAFIADKFQLARATPTLQGFGGSSCPGALVVTASGLVGAVSPGEGTRALATAEPLRPARARAQVAALTHKVTASGLVGAVSPGEGTRALATAEPLRPARARAQVAALTHKDGNILVACVSPGPRWCIRCALAGPPRPPRGPRAPPQLMLQPLPALHPPTPGPAPVTISWCLRDDTDCLLVAGTTLTLWKLTEGAHPVHKLLSKGPLQGSTTPNGGPKPGSDCFNTVVWQPSAPWAIEDGSRAVAVLGHKLPVAPPYVLLATPRTVHLLHRDTLHTICSVPVRLTGGESPAGASPPKKPKYGASVGGGDGCATVCSMDVSSLGGVACCVDTLGRLHVYRLPYCNDMPSPMAIQHTCNLLEYSMVSGIDCLDVLLTIKNSLVEPIYERFTESFQRQPQAFQQYYYHSWLKLRIALCRLVPSLSTSASWLCMSQMCACAWAAALPALRPDDRTDLDLDSDKDDRAPRTVTRFRLVPSLSTSASWLCMSQMCACAWAAALPALRPDDRTDLDLDSDKTLLTLESKPESCGDVSSLSSLRRLLQRALDTANAVLLSLHHTAHQTHGYEIWSDPSAVALLRKLVILSRACGRGGDALSRPLARLQASAPKMDLQEECASIASSSGARAWEGAPRCCVSAPHGRQYPLYLEYGVEPESLRFAPEPPAYLQADVPPPRQMDTIRYTYLGGGGGGGGRVVACGRCGAAGAALPPVTPGGQTTPAIQRPPLLQAADARLQPACRCGGKWTLVSNV